MDFGFLLGMKATKAERDQIVSFRETEFHAE